MSTAATPKGLSDAALGAPTMKPMPPRASARAVTRVRSRRSIPRIAVITDVAAAVEDPRVAIVDARLPSFYAGQGGGYPRPGHIPTAVNVPLTSVSAAGTMLAPAELKALFLAAGIRETDRVIVYCHIGQQASLVWFAAREAGFDARVFDGSFQQWSGSDRPVIAPADR